MIPSNIVTSIKFNFKHNRKSCFTIEGQPGVGKSAVIHQVAKELGCKLIEFRPGNHGIEDLIGLPNFLTDDNGVQLSTFAKPDWLPNADRDGEDGILFIDEFAQASTPMQNALSSLIHAPRQLHDYKFPDSWMIIVAYNGPKWRAATNKMPSHIQDRLKPEVKMEFSIEDWTHWAETDGNLDVSLIAYAKFRASIFDEKNFDPKERFNVTPRSVEMLNPFVSNALPEHIRSELVGGIIGPGHAAEFLSFMRIWKNLPDIDYLMKHPDKVPVPTAPDVLFALVQSLAYACTVKNADHLAAFTKNLTADFEVVFYKEVLRRDQSVAKTQAFADFLKVNQELIM
jgi:DNA polymerase III delta prime subunit